MSTQDKTKPKRWAAYVWLLAAVCLFYDLNPFYSLLLRAGVRSNLPIPAVIERDWKAKTTPVLIDPQPGRTISSIKTARGEVKTVARLCPGANLAVITVGGRSIGFNSPGKGLYGRLRESLGHQNVSSIQIVFRKPSDFVESVHDVRAAVELVKRTHKRIVLIGHSLGGAVVISTASVEPAVVGVAAISSQPYGAAPVRNLGDRSLLVVAGWLDLLEPLVWSSSIFKEAGVKDKQLVTLLASHGYDECADELNTCVFGWLGRFF